MIKMGFLSEQFLSITNSSKIKQIHHPSQTSMSLNVSSSLLIHFFKAWNITKSEEIFLNQISDLRKENLTEYFTWTLKGNKILGNKERILKIKSNQIFIKSEAFINQTSYQSQRDTHTLNFQ